MCRYQHRANKLHTLDTVFRETEFRWEKWCGIHRVLSLKNKEVGGAKLYCSWPAGALDLRWLHCLETTRLLLHTADGWSWSNQMSDLLEVWCSDVCFSIRSAFGFIKCYIKSLNTIENHLKIYFTCTEIRSTSTEGVSIVRAPHSYTILSWWHHQGIYFHYNLIIRNN